MAGIISAQSILKQKGFIQNKFDTNGFMKAVGQFFMDNSVESRLLLVPFRFLDICREPDTQYVYRFYNPFDITEDEEKFGYKVQTALSENKVPVFQRELFENDFEKYQKQREAGLLFPRIIVDKPFFENAAATLRLMGGYVVEKEMKKKRKLYWVTLI